VKQARYNPCATRYLAVSPLEIGGFSASGGHCFNYEPRKLLNIHMIYAPKYCAMARVLPATIALRLRRFSNLLAVEPDQIIGLEALGSKVQTA
jgi:hypothetical protein